MVDNVAKPASLIARASALVKVYGATQQVGGDVSGFLAPLMLVLQPSQRHPHRGTHLTSTMSILSAQNFLVLFSVLFVQVAADLQGE